MSLKKIAQMTGTSVSTVSRVLNHTSNTCASKKLQDKIFDAARAIGYQPNENARNLRRSSPGFLSQIRISIVLVRIKTLDADPFFYELFRSLEVALLENHIQTSQVIYLDEQHLFSIPKSQGIIILGRCSQKILDLILSYSSNVVGIWRNSMNFNVDEVICDGKKAAELAMNHLFSLGHKNIAYIGDCSYESRYIGYCNSLISNNIPINYEWIKQTNQTGEAGERALLELLKTSSEFSAVLCANDITAIHVLKALKENNRKSGKKISVISIDDITESQNTSPLLTTVHIPREEMAHMAVTLLLDRISRKHTETIRLEFPCRIVNRCSCYEFVSD